MSMGSNLCKNIHPVIPILTIVAFVVVCLAALWPRLAGLDAGAPWVPKKSPAEEDRVFHPDGFSMIPPPGWVAKSHEGEEKDLFDCSISFSPGSKGYRYAPDIAVKATKTAPDLSGFQGTRLNELQVYERTTLVGTGEHPLLHYQLVLQGKLQWYEVRYFTHQFRDNSLEIPEIMLSYLRSIRLQERGSHQP
jgi:hypothetical protein